MTTIRIYVEHDGPLDGLSPLHPEATSAWNAQLGLRELWLPAGVPLGRVYLDTLTSGSEHWIEHLTVLSASGVHQPGALVGLGAPLLEEVTSKVPPMIPLVDLGACEETNTGVLTEGLSTPILIDHALVFDTRANGSEPGPHLIQISLGPVPRLLQGSLPTLQPLLEGPQDAPEGGQEAPGNPGRQEAPKERLGSTFAVPEPPERDEDEEPQP